MQWLVRILTSLLPYLKALLQKPGREVIADFDNRSKDQVYTSDTEIEIKKDFLTLNKWSRPGIRRKGVEGIEVHWVANPKTSAKGNRQWFESRKGGKRGFGSTQFIIDQDGDIIQMIPEIEIAYSSGARHYKDGIRQKLGSRPYYKTLSIECTHVDWSGKMTPECYDSLANLCVHLCQKYNLTARHLYLHFDITGKLCHRWFVDKPNEWSEFKNLVDSLLEHRKSKTPITNNV